MPLKILTFLGKKKKSKLETRFLFRSGQSVRFIVRAVLCYRLGSEPELVVSIAPESEGEMLPDTRELPLVVAAPSLRTEFCCPQVGLSSRTGCSCPQEGPASLLGASLLRAGPYFCASVCGVLSHR